MANYVTIQDVREQAGFQYKEKGESLGTGDGATKIYYTDHKPIVARNYSGTPISASDVKVYASNVEVTVSAVDAAQGKITLSIAPTSSSPITGDYDWAVLDYNLVENYLDEAHSLILSKIAEVYTLPLSETPEVIKLIEKKLAAGLLLDKEYSVGGDETEDTRGRRWIKWAEAKLEEIVSGSLELLDNSNVVLAQKSGATLDGWPDETTKDAAEVDAGGDVKFRVKKDF